MIQNSLDQLRFRLNKQNLQSWEIQIFVLKKVN